MSYPIQRALSALDVAWMCDENHNAFFERASRESAGEMSLGTDSGHEHAAIALERARRASRLCRVRSTTVHHIFSDCNIHSQIDLPKQLQSGGKLNSGGWLRRWCFGNQNRRRHVSRYFSTAGGSFGSNGYTRTINSSFSNPLAGRQAWSGSSADSSPRSSTCRGGRGPNIQLRWRCASDSSVSSTGLVHRHNLNQRRRLRAASGAVTIRPSSRRRRSARFPNHDQHPDRHRHLDERP